MLNEKIRRMVALPAVKRGKEALGRELERTGMSVRRLAAEELIAGAAVELQPDAEAETVSEAGLAGELIPA
jgi:hypothetical protein